MRPDMFRKLLEFYAQKKLPADDSFLVNQLTRGYDISKGQTGKLITTFEADAAFVGFVSEIQGGTWVRLAEDLVAASDEEAPVAPKEAGAPILGVEREREVVVEDARTAEEREPDRPMQVFIGHGKNKKILEQLRTALQFRGFEPVVAEEKETPAIPAPDKVMEAMHNCYAAIQPAGLLHM